VEQRAPRALLHPFAFGYNPKVARNARADGVSVRDATFVE
jgi:hypothetical protein